MATLLVFHLLAIFFQLSSIQAQRLQELVDRSRIYLERGPRAIRIDEVSDLQWTGSVKLIIHGFQSSRESTSMRLLTSSYAAAAFENILVADWSSAADLDYVRSRRAVRLVADLFAQQLENFFAVNRVPLRALHIVGHSLGAHVAGCIGKTFNGEVNRITGLDPALPLFRPDSADSLQRSDARFVDIIHTGGPVIGDTTSRGHADFYPNFGRNPQPGCELLRALGSCSHSRATHFFAESIAGPFNFPAISCNSTGITGRDARICLPNLDRIAIEQQDRTRVTYMGEWVSFQAEGLFYLQTNRDSPFGQGVQAVFNGR